MRPISRRTFGATTLSISAGALKAANGIDAALRESMERRGIPAVAAIVATPDKVTWSGGFGNRDSASGLPVKTDSIFAIASMTKAVTTTAALQLVEQGKLTLTEPVGRFLPELAKLDVITGFDDGGKPVLRPAGRPVTLHDLLTHTSGFAYDTWDAQMFRYTSLNPPPVPILDFQPGARWQYGTSVDWAGRLVEKISDLTLEEYFQRNILKPLGMNDTSYILPESKFDRLISTWRRQPDGVLKEDTRTMPAPPKAYNGGGGLYSTPVDYIRFTQMILRKGQKILQPKTVEMMAKNQIGSLTAGRLKSQIPARSSDVDLHPGADDKWGYGFLINTSPYTGGRSAGSLAWAGIENTFYWIDPRKSLCAVIMMQFFPFVDAQAVGLLGDFERAVYAAAKA